MDIDGYDGSQLAPINENEALDTGALDNSLTANVNQMFDITSIETNDNNIEKYDENMDNENMDNENINDKNTDDKYDENMDNQNMNNKYVENMESKSILPEKIVNTFLNIGIFVIIWITIGIIAFIVSLFCFEFSGSMSEKIIGLLLAIFFGPFYFIYFYLNKNYCGKKTSSVKSD